MSVLKYLFLFVFLSILGLSGYVALAPSEYTVHRQVSIKSDPFTIFPYINNSKKMNEWNPWMKVDPNVEITFSGPESGLGAKTSWKSQTQLGTGSATITESEMGSKVQFMLDYVTPYPMQQIADITLTASTSDPSKKETTVQWSVNGKNDFIGKAFYIMMGVEKMIGTTFETGLSDLKSIVEKENSQG
jgi:hypothetical protein